MGQNFLPVRIEARAPDSDRRTQPVSPAMDRPQPVATMDSPTQLTEFLPLPDIAEFDAPILPRDEKIRVLAKLDREQVSICTKCRLSQTRKHTVFGEGDVDAQLMFIGEGPGETEDLTGRPFVGRAGHKLDEMIAAMGLRREQVYIANIVKCRPPENRAPAPDETESCTPYLVKQIEVIRPKVIVTLGLPASKYMLQSALSMGKLRGRWHAWRGIKLMPTYHPAYILRNYTLETRKAVWEDLKKVAAELGLKTK